MRKLLFAALMMFTFAAQASSVTTYTLERYLSWEDAAIDEIEMAVLGYHAASYNAGCPIDFKYSRQAADQIWIDLKYNGDLSESFYAQVVMELQERYPLDGCKKAP